MIEMSFSNGQCQAAEPSGIEAGAVHFADGTTSSAPASAVRTAQDQFMYWSYRVGAYVLLNVLDEPAWLALIFC